MHFQVGVDDPALCTADTTMEAYFDVHGGTALEDFRKNRENAKQ
jgi:hypothetical protein